MNILATSKSQGNQQNTKCSLCNHEDETVGHFLFRCPIYDSIRSPVLNILTGDPSFAYLNEESKIRYVLGLECSDRNIGKICNFISKMYKKRESCCS